MNGSQAIASPRYQWITMACACAAFTAFAVVGILGEPPLGRVQGRVLDSYMHPVANARVWLTPAKEGGPTYATRVRTSADGRFALNAVPAGSYIINASSRAHGIDGPVVYVEEGRVTPLALRLQRTFDPLTCSVRARTYLPSEAVSVTVTGYRIRQDAGDPPMTLTLSQLDVESLLPSPEGLRRYRDVFASWSLPSALPAALTRASRNVAIHRVDLRRTDVEGHFDHRVKIGALPPGAYIATARYGAETVYAPFTVTDLGLIVRKSGAQAYAFAVDLKTGRPKDGVQIRAFQGSGRVGEGVTGPDGLARLALSENGSDDEDTWAGVLASRGSNRAWAFGYDYQEGEADYRLHVYTDRPIYRPGQQVRYKGILRGVGRSGGAYTVPANVPVRVRVEDPEGIVLAESQRRTNAFGSFSGDFELSSETPSGSGTIFAEVGTLREAYSFTIASYRKPEFQVEATPRRSAYVAGDTVEVDVDARYYYGAPLVGATVACSTVWDDLWEWAPDAGEEDEEGPWWRQQSEFGSVTSTATAQLDAQGRCVVRIPTAALAPGATTRGLTASISISVRDPAGRMVETSTSVRVYTGEVRLFVEPAGYLCSPGRRTFCRVRAFDLASRPVASLPIKLDVYRDDTRRPNAPVRSQNMASVSGTTDSSGMVTLAFTPTQAGELRLAASARDTRNRTVTATDYLWCVGDRGGDLSTSYADLSVHCDRRQYAVGDTARILINSDRTGSSVIVTVDGDRIYEARVVTLAQRSTVLTLPIRSEYGPNVWVSVSGIWSKKYAETTAQIRVAVPDRELRVTVTPDAPEHRPQESARFRIAVADARGKPVQAEASFALVDEAIYALVEDDPSAVMEAFYPHVYSRVTAMHSCEEYLYSGDKAQPVIAARRKFLDAPYWNAHVITDAEGQAVVDAPLPDNLTTWRATAVAHSVASQFGWATAQVRTNLPFHIRLDTPRFLTETDRATVTASVANATSQPRRASVRLSGESIEILGDGAREIDVPAGGTALAQWMVRAARAGACTIRADAWSSGTPHLSDAVEHSIPILPYAREITHVFAGDLVETRSQTHVFEASAQPLPAAVTIRTTPSVLSAIPSAVEYLVTYPYGCTEQTVSGFLPNLYVARLLKALPDPTARALRTALGADVDDRIRRSVRDGVSRLGKLRNYDGSFGWFEADPGDAWLTAYALLALSEIRRDGYLVSDRMIEETATAASRLLNGAEPDQRAFLALALASVGVNAVHRLDMNKLRPAGLACASLAMRRLGMPDTARRGPDEMLLPWAYQSDRLVHWRNSANPWSSEWTETMTTALAVRALLARNPADAMADRALRYLMLNRTDAHWTSTRDTAFVLMALCDYVAARPQSAPVPAGVRVKLNDTMLAATEVEPGNLLAREIVQRIAKVPIRPGPNRLVIEPAGEGQPYYSLAVRTQSAGDLRKPITTIPEASVIRTYEQIRTALLPLRGAVRVFDKVAGPVRSGTLIRCRIIIRTPNELPFVMVTDPIPAGAEPSAKGDVDAEWNEWYSASDVRDDRVVFFARSVPRGRHVLEYYLRAQTPGSYRAMPTRLECMYDPSVRIETSVGQMEIR
ncbi:MAG: hypothetical protein GX446_00300 [Chthonomonadales bacterium]|nr:hypothetical protein [Chthonomonadales bacterium]